MQKPYKTHIFQTYIAIGFSTDNDHLQNMDIAACYREGERFYCKQFFSNGELMCRIRLVVIPQAQSNELYIEVLLS
jgi:hypothetical protein